MSKRTLIIFILFVLGITLLAHPAFCAANKMADYLCELGLKFYKLGRYEDALIEFRKALIVDPGNKTAKEYTNKIFKSTALFQQTVGESKIEKPVQKAKNLPLFTETLAPAPAAKKPFSLEAGKKPKSAVIISLQQLIAEAEKNIKIIDEKIQKQEAKKPKSSPPPQPKKAKVDKKALALAKKQQQEEAKKQKVIEKQLVQLEQKKKK